MSHSLPLNLAASAWCRCHPSRMDALRVAISAPEGTPYAAGVFVFDVRVPPSFPAAPPSGKGDARRGGASRGEAPAPPGGDRSPATPRLQVPQ